MARQIKVEGLEALLGKLSADLLKKPMREFFKRATIAVQGTARKRSPVDTGYLRSSISNEIDGRDVPLWGKVGTDIAVYPEVLEESARHHYAAGPFKGQQTQHWLSGSLVESENVLKGLLDDLGDDIRKNWER